MNPTTTFSSHGAAPRIPYAARALFALLERIRGGRLVIAGPNGFERSFGDGEPGGRAARAPCARMVLADWGVIDACLKRGDIGFAETYMEGRWHADDLAALVEIFSRNRAAMEAAVYGSALGGFFYRLKHLFNRNTRTRARRNIEAHYDLGNDFYKLWLDPSMSYSSALYDGRPETPLAGAQAAKYRRILGRLDPRPGDRILEIGCGWGGFAEIAAREHGVHVTGLTLSSEQLRYARARLDAAGLGDKADFLLTDYRDMRGAFDHVVSIEMFEAVGEAYWDGYFACVHRNLKPGGRALVQTITIDDALFERYRRGTDFIQQYIFPGGMLPSPSRFRAAAAGAGLAINDAFAFGRDYAITLARWRESFMQELPQVRRQGFDEPFLRLWELYLAYCEGAFNAGSTDVIQFELERGRP